MKKLLLGTSFAALAVVSATALATSASTDTTKNEAKVVSKLLEINKTAKVEFIQIAQASKLSPVADKAGQYKLTLTGLDKEIYYFSDRPEHITGKISNTSFYKMWNDGKDNYSKIPPNAALEATEQKSGNHVNYVFELSNPQYQVASNEVTYDAKLLGQKTLPQSEMNLGYSTLFIDNVAIHWHNHGQPF